MSKKKPRYSWDKATGIVPVAYTCGFCGREVATSHGFPSSNALVFVGICSFCDLPTCFQSEPTLAVAKPIQVPAPPYGKEVANLPDDVQQLYSEMRGAFQSASHTGIVLCARKLLMHIAVDKEAEEGKTFAHYIDYLAGKHFIPPGGKDWVDQIRKQGNEKTHEIKIASLEEAREMVDFCENLLRFVYDFPARARANSE